MTKFTNAEMCLLWLDSFESLEYKHKKEIFNLIDGKENIKSAIASNKENLIPFLGEERFNILSLAANNDYFSSVLNEIDRHGITPITLFSKNYPERLKDTPIPPLVLYAKGDIGLLNEKCFAIVGSRKSSALAIKTAEKFSSALTDAGFTLVSGIAEGVDKTVLESALNGSGKVVSVVAGGFGNIYPKSHVNLFDSIAERGLVLSEHPYSVVPKPYMFPVRNRIIAGLSVGALIVSAGIKSGALYTAEYAEEYSRQVFAVPYSVGVVCGEGSNELIKRGAMLCDSVSDILSFYGIEEKKKEISLSKPEEEIIKILKDGDKHIEKICSALNKKIYEITPLISSLEIKGYITQSGINVYTLCQIISEE